MSTAGRATREALDFYKTPEAAVKSLFSRLSVAPDAVAFEPCLGGQDIAAFFPCDTVYYCELQEGVDYLSDKEMPLVDLLVTNLPFTYAQEFIEKSFTHTTGVIAYFLRLNFLGSRKRKEWWLKYPVTHLYVLSQRPSFTGQGTDATEYAWFVWERSKHGKVKVLDAPGIHVL
jgi:hypothetical protein